MTTVSREEKTCAVCGKTSAHLCMDSTSAFGSPDLDTRPPEVARSAIDMWVQECPSCGYCAPDISEAPDIAPEIVRSEPYKTQLTNTEFPELANEFLCSAIIEEALGEYADAGWTALSAAWACDDADSEVSARKCRDRTAELFYKAEDSGESFAEENGGEEAILVDLLRRSGNFEKALEYCEKGLAKEPDNVVRKVLEFERSLVQNSDIDCHTIEEAMGEEA